MPRYSDAFDDDKLLDYYSSCSEFDILIKLYHSLDGQKGVNTIQN